MRKFLQRLFLGTDDSLIKILRDELKMLREQLSAKDRQIEMLQGQIGSVLSYQYDRPKIVQEVPDSRPSLPIDTLSDVHSDDEEFVKAMQIIAHD